MLKKTYAILKYIYKNPNISKSELLRNFPDFETYEQCISAYIYVTDNNTDIVSEIDTKLRVEASNKGLNMSEASKYVANNMPDIQNVTDNNLIIYSTNLAFDEYHEKRKRELLLFWLPYSITTVIAICSLIAQILN